MATLSEVADRLDVQIRDSDTIWECSQFIKNVYPDIGEAETCLKSQRAVLVSTNSERDVWNTTIQNLRTQVQSVSLAGENVLKDGELPQASIDAYTNNNIPPTVLNLKIGDLLLVTAVTSVESKGICKNRRVRLVDIGENGRVLRIASLDTGEEYFLPRRWFRDIRISRQGSFDRLQFPVQLSYAMTVHKCQGQTMVAIGIDASVPYFDGVGIEELVGVSGVRGRRGQRR
jgi:hypothetical protein